jgi:hypothetical protein
VTGIAASAHADYAAPTPPVSFETEVVREIEPRASEPERPVRSGPGYAPAEPVRIEWPSDLVQVESDPEKLQAGRQPEVEQQPAQRPKRARPPMQPVSEEPLVQIETGPSSGAAPGGNEPKEKETALPR